MTEQELYTVLTKIIATPHTAITRHDKRRAIHSLIAFQEYAIGTEGLDLNEFINEKLDELEQEEKK